MDIWGTALKNGVNEAHAHMMRAFVIQEQSDTAHALEEAQFAIKLAPQDTFIAYLHGMFYTRARDYKKAIGIYSQVIERRFLIPDVFVMRASAYSRLDQFELANKDFEMAIRLNPYIGNTYNGRAYHLARYGQYQSSLGDANRCIAIEPVFKYGYGTRGLIHFLMENYQEALTDFEKAEELNKNDGYSLVGQSVSYQRL